MQAAQGGACAMGARGAGRVSQPASKRGARRAGRTPKGVNAVKAGLARPGSAPARRRAAATLVGRGAGGHTRCRSLARGAAALTAASFAGGGESAQTRDASIADRRLCTATSSAWGLAQRSGKLEASRGPWRSRSRARRQAFAAAPPWLPPFRPLSLCAPPPAPSARERC